MAYPSLSPGARLLAVHLRDNQGNPIGDVKEWMMDIEQGRVVYVLSTIGTNQEEYLAFPWPVMQADKEKGGYRVNVDAERLEQAPRISKNNLASLVSDTGLLDSIYSFFGVQPYWQSGEPATEASGQTNQPASQSTPQQTQRGFRDGHAHPFDLKEVKDEENPDQTTNQAIQSEGKGYGG